MKGFLLAAMMSLPLSSIAQYNGPAVEACRNYALKELQRERSDAKAVVIERDSSLSMERIARKAGSQPVSSILSGNGAVVYANVPSAELSFLCLLADERRPVFFSWLARADAPAATQCTRSETLRGKSRECLELLLRIAEQDLSGFYANRFHQAIQRGEPSLAAYRKSNDEWREYRDAECTRRRELAPSDISPQDYEIGCRVELTRRRALDMK